MRRLLPLIAVLLAGCATQPQTEARSDSDDKALGPRVLGKGMPNRGANSPKTSDSSASEPVKCKSSDICVPASLPVSVILDSVREKSGTAKVCFCKLASRAGTLNS